MNFTELFKHSSLDEMESFDVLYQKWLSHEEELTIIFHQRNLAAAKEPMLECLALFIKAIYWIHDEPIPETEHELAATLPMLPYTPINVDERLSYLLKKPVHYLSFIQLKELYKELKKKEAIMQLKRKR